MKNSFLPLTEVAACLFFFAACTSQSGKDELSKLDFMLGNWESDTEDGKLFEIWNKQDSKTFTGRGFAIEGGDTTFSENMQVMETDSGIFYIVSLNGEESVSFKLIEAKEKTVFENPAHDFPQRIIYWHTLPDSLFARIEGMVDGVGQKEDFAYRRISDTALN